MTGTTRDEKGRIVSGALNPAGVNRGGKKPKAPALPRPRKRRGDLSRYQLLRVAIWAAGSPAELETERGQEAAKAACAGAWLASVRPPKTVRPGACAQCQQSLLLGGTPQSAPILAEDGCRVHLGCHGAYARRRWDDALRALRDMKLEWWKI